GSTNDLPRLTLAVTEDKNRHSCPHGIVHMTERYSNYRSIKRALLNGQHILDRLKSHLYSFTQNSSPYISFPF
ncbi:hypothetical protein SK128_013382, partial [Halocaridina rubra]